MWPDMTHVANPLYKSGVCFDQFKIMCAVGGKCHID